MQSTVSSLLYVSLQVLATVKHQIEELAATRKDFPELITAAQHWLLARETSFMATGDNTPTHAVGFYASYGWNLYLHTDL